MGLAADAVTLQSRMLNRGKGPAVHSLRVQADKRAYHLRMLKTLFSQPHLTVRQGEAAEILTENGKVSGVKTLTGDVIPCRAVVRPGVCGDDGPGCGAGVTDGGLIGPLRRKGR